MGEVTADGDIIIGRIRPKNNPLIHRSEVGKPAFHNDMPPLPKDYTFGAPLKKDAEGAGEVMLTWQEHRPPASKVSYDFGRDFMTLNKRSVKAQCVNAKEVASYRSNHDARLKPKVTGTKPQTLPAHVRDNPTHSYGSKSGESEGVADLIQNRFELEWVAEQQKHQREMEEQQRAEKDRQRARQQRASPTRVFRRADSSPVAESPHPREFFTLKQFRDVPSRFRTPTPGLNDQVAAANASAAA